MSTNRDLFGIPKSPQSSEASMLRLFGGSLDANNNFIFSTVEERIGDAITYIHNGTTADIIKINRSGVYSISVTAYLTGGGSAAENYGITRNSDTTLTWSATPQTYVLINGGSTGDLGDCASVVVYLNANDYIAFNASSSASAGSTFAGAGKAVITLISPA